jgi:para-nitrobenzyl esterase
VGAYHSSELWYTFQTLGRSWRPFTEADYQLSDEMVDAWTNFCKFGNPNGAEGDAWAPYKNDAPFIKVFDIKK